MEEASFSRPKKSSSTVALAMAGMKESEDGGEEEGEGEEEKEEEGIESIFWFGGKRNLKGERENIGGLNKEIKKKKRKRRWKVKNGK